MMAISRRKIVVTLFVSLALFSLMADNLWAQARVIGVIQMAQVNSSTRRAQEAFVANAATFGWKTIVIDGEMDFEKIRAAFDEVIAQKVDGIVNVLADPQMLQEALAKAKAAGIPVISIDAGYDPNVVTNLTTNNYVGGGRYTSYLLDVMRQRGQTKLLATVFPHHYATRIRYEMLRAALLDYPEIALIEEHQVALPGAVEDCQAWMTEYLTAHPDFEGGVWNAWDEPAEGVIKAVEQLGRKHITAAAIDGTDWALAQLRKNDPANAFLGTEVQNYELMGAMAANIMRAIFDGTKQPTEIPSVIYVPSLLLTPQNVPEEGYPWTSSGDYKPGYEKLLPWPQY